ncbi:hypothetical protein [Spirillospora sp. NPDC047279]|uniref:hypothetical protein n=1 Tax=Spirillospora sp. NPDC047279 TaxID=3155478 RepID=UPI0033F5588D
MGERDEVRIAGIERDDGLMLRTHGLAAGGLPEIRVVALPPYLGQGWAQVMGALAQCLASGGATVPDQVEIAPGVAVQLKVENGELVPMPPHGFQGSLDDWRRDVLSRMFPSATT